MAGDLAQLAQLATQGDFDGVRQLATRNLVTVRDERGHTILMRVADAAAETPVPSGKCIEYLLHLGADPMAADSLGDTAAHLAARRDHLRLLALLPFEAKWLQNGSGASPLIDAAGAGSWRCAKHLLHLFRQWRYKYKKYKLLGLKNERGRTALDMARDSGHAEIARCIER